MKIINERTKIRDIAKRWKNMYYHNNKWSGTSEQAQEKEKIYNQFVALDPETSIPEDVNNMIGNSSWIGPEQCHECNNYVSNVIQLGQEPDYESSTANICKDCLRKALALITTSNI